MKIWYEKEMKIWHFFESKIIYYGNAFSFF